MFTGLSAFPLTPIHNGKVDDPGLTNLITRLVDAKVDSIGVLGSTGSYPYLNAEERAHVAKLSVELAGDIPVIVGVGDLRTVNVLTHVENAQKAGAAAVILAPMAFHSLTNFEVLELFTTVTERTDLPVIVYDNPSTSHFQFSLDLYRDVSHLPGVVGFKIPPTKIAAEPAEAKEKIDAMKAVIPEDCVLGISGDHVAAVGLTNGCQAWYSGVAGTLPHTIGGIARPALAGDYETAAAETKRLEPLWDLFAKSGGHLRVGAAIAEYLGIVKKDCLPRPIRGLDAESLAEVERLVDELHLS